MTYRNGKGRPGQGDQSITNHTITDHSSRSARQSAYANADTWWKSCAEQALKVLADTGRPFTVDQVALLVPKPDHSCRLGALFAAAVRRDQIALVGAQISAEDGRPLRTWQGVRHD